MALVGKETIDDVEVNETDLNPDPADAIKPAEDAEATEKKEEKKADEEKDENEIDEDKEKEEALKQPRMVRFLTHKI